MIYYTKKQYYLSLMDLALQYKDYEWAQHLYTCINTDETTDYKEVTFKEAIEKFSNGYNIIVFDSKVCKIFECDKHVQNSIFKFIFENRGEKFTFKAFKNVKMLGR